MAKKPTPIQRAVQHLGGQANLARAIGLKYPALVYQWVNGLRPVAAKHCIAIETATGGEVTRHQLCPDVFGDTPDSKAA